MKATCRELADAGYIAISPDLFWRLEPGLSLSHWTDAEWKKALSLYERLDLEKGVEEVTTPTIMHIGEQDEFISRDALATIAAGVAHNPHITLFTYPGCAHAFARHSGTRFDADAAALANQRTYDHFEAHLR